GGALDSTLPCGVTIRRDENRRLRGDADARARRRHERRALAGRRARASRRSRGAARRRRGAGAAVLGAPLERGGRARRRRAAGRALLADAGRIDTRAFYAELDGAGLAWRAREEPVREEGLPLTVKLVEVARRC